MAYSEANPLVNECCAKGRRNRWGSRHPSIVASVRVEIFSDVVCPWCYIGKRRFDAAVANLAGLGVDLDLEVEFRPFLLDPTARPGIATPVADAYAKKFGGHQRAAEIIAHITEIAAKENLAFRLDRAVRANTMLAHRLSFIARRDCGIQKQTQLEERLFSAYFMEGLNIGDLEVLLSIASEIGMDAASARDHLRNDDGLAQVEAEIRLAAESGILAVPTFIFDGKWSIPGAQDVDVFERVLLRLHERTG